MNSSVKRFIKQTLMYLLAVSVGLLIIIVFLASIKGAPADRYVEVYDSASGEVLWTFEGNCYLTERKHIGNYTITYYTEDGNTGRADFVGSTINIIVIDK